MKNNKINSALEGREYLIDQLKKQLIGPLNEHFTSDCLVQQFNPNNPNFPNKPHTFNRCSSLPHS